MIERLVNVIYWTFCVLALCPILYGISVIVEAGFEGAFAGDTWYFALLFASVAIPIYLIGRAIRYIVLGK